MAKTGQRALAALAAAALMALASTGCRHRAGTESPTFPAAVTFNEAHPSVADTAAAVPAVDVRKPDMQVRVLKGDALYIETDGLSLTALGGSVRDGGEYSVTALAEGDLPPMPQGMENMTSQAAGYRLLPSGDHFSPAAELRVAYDPGRLPAGYTPDDIYTSYYDSVSMAWVRLERIGIDTASREVVSLTTHFTDFANEILKVPEMPETQAFVPTTMTGLEAVNPMEGIALFQPPTANQEGTASLSYPIWTPSGRNGMQPSLALNYSSSGGNGWLGVGWDISVPSVTVDTRWGVPRYSRTHETESYLLCGVQLVTKDASGRQDPLPHRTNQQRSRMTGDVRYHARTGDAHDSITRHGDTPSEYWWEVTGRNGVTHYYGHYPYGGLDGSHPSTLAGEEGSRARWMLCESRDTYGNWVRYFYDTVVTTGINPGRQIYLDSIVFTGHLDEDGVYSVVFHRKGRCPDDIPVTCMNGFKEETDQVLCNIVVKSGDSVFTGYFFETECTPQSGHKTRLAAVGKMDDVHIAGAAEDILEKFCINGENNDIRVAVTRHEFRYHDAPGMDTLFAPARSMPAVTDNVRGFMLNPRHRRDSVNRATALGLTHTSEWSVGGSATVGLGAIVYLTTSSVGGNYHRGKSTSESLMTLVDLDGDGLADKVFVHGGKMYWRRQALSPDGDITFGDTHHVRGVSHFLVEGSRSNTFGVQASVATAGGSAEWTRTASVTATYFADVNGDGLTDMVDNGRVLFNSLADGQPTFTPYEVRQLPDGDPSDPPFSATPGCGGIIFDGGVNDTVACTIEWALTADEGPVTREEAVAACAGQPEKVLMRKEFVEESDGYHVLHYTGTLDCSSRDLAMDGVPATEAVRVWVSPDKGRVVLGSYVRLADDGSPGRAGSRHADGVTYTIQHSRNVSAMGDTLHSMKDTVLMSRFICAGCFREDAFDKRHYDSTYTFYVSKGDILLFRLQSNADNQYDNVEDHVRIELNGNTYTSENGFMLTEDKWFQAPYNGHYKIDGAYSNGDASISLGIKQPSGAYHYGGGALEWSGAIAKDSAIIIALSTTNSAADWKSVKLGARIRFWSDSLPDTVTVWTPGNRLVVHTPGSVWGNAVYRRLFGRLYNGWGQFAYRPAGGTAPGAMIRPGSLVPPGQSLAYNASDTIGLRARINAEIGAGGFDRQSMDEFTEDFGSQYSIMNDSSCWVPMDADSRHGRWVAYGVQNSIGRDTMSNSVQEGWYSDVGRVSADSSAYLVTDAFFDDAVPAQVGATPVKGIRKVNRSHGNSWSFGVAGFGISHSRGSSVVETDCIDMNGDRYPDIVGTHSVQYRSQWGGMGDVKALPVGMCEVTASTTSSHGYRFGADATEHRRTLSGNLAKAKFTLSGDGSSGSLSTGRDSSSSSWTDVNGDGLPDYVAGNGMVRLNTGYGFLAEEDWHMDSIHSGQSASASISDGIAGTLGKFNVSQGSIQLGAALCRSANRNTLAFIDVNGDGLQDMVWRDVSGLQSWIDVLFPTASLKVRLNLGGGRWSQTQSVNIQDFNWSDSFNESLNIGYTTGATFLGAFKVNGGLNGTPYGSSVSRDRIQLVDVNGDGLPDLVASDSESGMTVRYNKGGRTNLLRQVTNSTGSRIHLEYTLSEPCHGQPSRQWLLTQVTTGDPLNPNGGDTSVTRFTYADPHYDRMERTSYGYGIVVTEQVRPSDNSVYRTVRREFHNENMLFRGRPKRELTCDGEDNRYIERVYRYDFASCDNGPIDTCSGNAYSVRDRVVTRFYEGAAQPLLSTAEAYEYDRYHNVVRYIDEGDTAYADDGLYIVMTYLEGQPHNLIGLRSGYTVYHTGESGTGWLRQAGMLYNDKGRPVMRTLHNTGQPAVYESEYDSYGNLIRAVLPANDSMQRMAYTCSYDAYTHSLPVKVKNSFGDSVLTAYSHRFGRPTMVTDPSGSSMAYAYDMAGRLVSVTSPLNTSGTPSLKNEYCFYSYCTAPSATGLPFQDRPYAVSTHYDDQGVVVTRTVVITDGFGRVIQTKKGMTANGVTKLQVSGREFTDAFGRVTGRHDVSCEDIGTGMGGFNSQASPLIDTVDYDILDRETSIRQPAMGYTTTRRYGVHNDTTGRRRFWSMATDPNGHSTVQYTDYDGRRTQVTDAMGGRTVSTFDALGQTLSVTDPEGFTTTYSYDRLGRMTQRVHPDAGMTQYDYDAAGNVTHETTPLGDIYFDYSYDRLAKKRYGDITGNNVSYTYGTGGTGRGRPVRIEDGTGVRQLSYDALGNIVSETRTVAVPGSQNVYVFSSGFQYDSWGRMRSMTYPDGETVTYTYAFGGDLASMYGDKGSEHHSYVASVRYNTAGQRERIDYGNGTHATYAYDALHRLTAMSGASVPGTMQQIQYSFDGAGNIHSVANTAPTVGSLGGAYTESHVYDALDRLVSSTGTGNAYSVAMDYSPSGRAGGKRAGSVSRYFGYCNDLKPHAPRRVYVRQDKTLHDLVWDDAGNLGQVNTAVMMQYDRSRFLYWTEDSRLHTVSDGAFHSYYAYDHAGERTLKMTGGNNVIDLNADVMLTSSALDDITLYPSPFIVVTRKGYTKHYYAGDTRLCARIGRGGLQAAQHDASLSGKAGDIFSDCLDLCNGRELVPNERTRIIGLSWDDDTLRAPMGDAPNGQTANVTVDASAFEAMLGGLVSVAGSEDEAYFYHGDHLGSANWITDAAGVPVQHLRYLPFGEPLVNQRTSGYSERFTFTGKERDEETGFGYFGARYMDHELMTMWLSVDPMADKYPGISPYAYCAWNPIILVDPNGNDTVYYNLNGNKLFTRTGGENINMMVLTTQANIDEKAFSNDSYYSFDLGTLDIATLDGMYDFSDKNRKECYYAIRGDGTPTDRQTGTEDDVPDALFDAVNWRYNVHTHCKSKLVKEPKNVTNNTEPSMDKDMVGVGEKFGIILGYSRINMDAGSTGMTFNNGESPNKPKFRYKREISFYDSKGKIGNGIPYDDFKKTVRKIKTGR